jgi:hypothetical protein
MSALKRGMWWLVLGATWPRVGRRSSVGVCCRAAGGTRRTGKDRLAAGRLGLGKRALRAEFRLMTAEVSAFRQ